MFKHEFTKLTSGYLFYFVFNVCLLVYCISRKIAGWSNNVKGLSLSIFSLVNLYE